VSDDPADPKKSRFDSVIPELLKRAVERGVEKAIDAPHDLKSFVGEMKLPKEIAHYIFAQVDETKNGLFRVVGHEVRDFLEHTNFAGEMQKILTTVQFEINTTIRFTPNDGSSASEGGSDGDGNKAGGEKKRDSIPPASMPKPEVKTEVQVTAREPRPRRRSRE
jgi:hypothetical protein